MKKIFARLSQVDADSCNSHSHTSTSASQCSSFVGRQFQVGHLAVVVDGVIAEGGFGTVYRVHSHLGKVYALKRTCVNSDEKLAFCRREITIVSSISHKNILSYVDSTINMLEPGISEVLLLTAYYPGSLAQLLNARHQSQRRLSEVEVCRVLCDLCEAVCRLHHCKTPIIHRDLKLENILIDNQQNFVLCDFGSATSRVLHPGVHGIARCQDEIEKHTTPSYRAPEMVDLYKSIPLGPQVDIWAMGCLLYCLCFHVLPFGDSPLAIQSGNYSIPDSSPYSDRLHKLIGYLLSVDPAHRPDIFQTSHLAFSLTNSSNPTQNLNNLPIPRWADLPTPLRKSQKMAVNSSTELSKPTPKIPSTDPPTSSQPVNTSIAPRQRPKASATPHTAGPHKLPIPLKTTPFLPPTSSSPTCCPAPSTTVTNSPVTVLSESSSLVSTSSSFGEKTDHLELGFTHMGLPPGWHLQSAGTEFNAANRGHQRAVSLDVSARTSNQPGPSIPTDRMMMAWGNKQPFVTSVNTSSNSLLTSPWVPFTPAVRQSQSLYSLATPSPQTCSTLVQSTAPPPANPIASWSTPGPSALPFPSRGIPDLAQLRISQPNLDENALFFAAIRQTPHQV